MDDNKVKELLGKDYIIKNRSVASVGYTIPDSNGRRRSFAPGELKRSISGFEIEGLCASKGGKKLFESYLMIDDKNLLDYLEIDYKEIPEYFYTEVDAERLLSAKGELDEFEDALNFAPKGFVEMLTSKAVENRLFDTRKVELIKTITGYDVLKAIQLKDEPDFDEEVKKEAPTRKTNQTPVRNRKRPVDTPAKEE